MTHPFKMDERWTLWIQSDSYDEFSSKCIPDMYLKPEVPEEIRQMFAFVKRVAEISYFEWELYDVAALKALQTFEAALKIRYKELTGTEWQKATMSPLVGWFDKRGYFEALNKEFMQAVINVRNHQSHPERHTIGGMLFRQWIEHSRDCVNGLYEDVSLRKQRKELIQKINNWITNQTTQEWVLDRNGKEYYLVNRPIFLFYDNKNHTFHFRFHVINILEEYEAKNESTMGVLSLTATAFELLHDRLILKTGEDVYTLTLDLKALGESTFKNWHILMQDMGSKAYEDHLRCEIGVTDELNTLFRSFLKI